MNNTPTEAIREVIAFVEANKDRPGFQRAREATSTIADAFSSIIAITKGEIVAPKPVDVNCPNCGWTGVRNKPLGYTTCPDCYSNVVIETETV